MATFTLTPLELIDQLDGLSKQVLPYYYFDNERSDELKSAFIEVFVQAFVHVDEWVRNTRILIAEGKWLDQHARDRGIHRQAGEVDSLLRERIRKVDDVVTVTSILSFAQDVIDSGSGAGTVYMVELPFDAAYIEGSDANYSAYLDCGYRLSQSGRASAFIIILPYGTTDEELISITAVADQRKAAGVRSYVERREVP